MVNKSVETLPNSEFDSKENVVEEVCAVVDDLCLQNQTLEDNVLHIHKRHQNVDHR